MKRLLTILLLTFATATVAFGQSTNKKVEDEILKLGSELEKGDAATWERLTTDDFTITFLIPAKTFTKAELAARMKNPRYTIESIIRDDTKLRVYGDAAIVTGHIKEVRKRPDGSISDFEGRFTETWVKQKGKWLLAARHDSPAFGVLKRE